MGKTPSRRSLGLQKREDRLSQKQREALWKWRWLGLRDSTPAFKVCAVLLVAVAVYIVVRAVTNA